MSKENLFSYIVPWDAGLAPNPYWGKCTLAVCKPQIRVTAREGDWVLGLAPRSLGYAIVYAMRVSEVLSFGEYFEDQRFSPKKPAVSSADHRIALGDNFYQPDGGGYVQLPSAHSNSDGSENSEHMRHDLSGQNVLLAQDFYYYGSNAIPLPEQLEFTKVGRGHRSRFNQTEIMAFLHFMETLEPGIHGDPRDTERAMRKLRGEVRGAVSRIRT